MKKKKKYKYGTVRNYLETPQEAMAENEISKAKAMDKASSNPWATGLNILGNAAIQYGTSQMSKGVAEGEGADGKGLEGFLANNQEGVGGFMQMMQMFGNAGQFAMGGEATGQIEAEGDEVVQTADGQVTELKGPKHESGGIDLNVPPGTDIYSDRIFVEGKSIADRKKARENKLKSLEKKILNKGNDKVLEDTITRTKKSLALEEDKDLKLQSMINFIAGSQGKAMYGLNDNPGLTDLLTMLTQGFSGITGNSDDYHTGDNNVDYTSGDRPIVRTASTFDTPSFNPDIQGGTVNTNPQGTYTPTQNSETNTSPDVNTFGNMVGLFGNMVSTFGPYKNTLKNRAGDTPNINAFKDYGNDALDVNEETQGYIAGQKDNALKDIDRATVGSKNANRNSARSVNTQRALDLSSDMAANKSRENVFDNFSKQMMQVLGQKASLESDQDRVVMQGEKERDMNDRRDRDNFYTQLAQDISTMGQGLQQTGKDLNQVEQQKAIAKILSQLNKYGVTFDENYNLQNPKNNKPANDIGVGSENINPEYTEAVKMIGTSQEKVKGLPSGSQYDPSTDTYIVNGVRIDAKDIDKFRK